MSTELYYDLHLHSCLSPCGDEDMTPANICGMAALAGLECIALTDHNTCRNVRVFCRHAEAAGLLGIPGMELCTREEVHVVCLFPHPDAAEAFSDYVYQRMPPIPNRPKLFGSQDVRDENDELCATEDRLLLSAADIGLYDVPALIKAHGGIAYPAHIDRDSFSLLANLGFWDAGMGFSLAERTTKADMTKMPNLPYVISSDAHRLDAIPDACRRIALDRINPQGLIDALAGLMI